MIYKVDYLKLQQREEPGNINDFVTKVQKEVLIDKKELLRHLPYVLKTFRESKKKAYFEAYYIQNLSIMKIKWNYGECNYGRVENAIESMTKDIIKYLLKIYPPAELKEE